VLACALPTYLRAHHEFEARMQVFHAAPKGAEVAIAPYSDVDRSSWFYGEDLASSPVRSLVAESYHLGAIEFSRPFGTLEAAGHDDFELAWSWAPGSPDAARPEVETLATHDLAVARMLFDERVAVARARGAGFRTASLVVTNLDFPGRKARRVIAARQLGERSLTPLARAYGADRTLRYRFLVATASFGGDLPETYVVFDGRLQALEPSADPRVVYYRPTVAARYALVRCDADECVLLESAWSGV
jgi:hypothetical protein